MNATTKNNNKNRDENLLHHFPASSIQFFIIGLASFLTTNDTTISLFVNQDTRLITIIGLCLIILAIGFLISFLLSKLYYYRNAPFKSVFLSCFIFLILGTAANILVFICLKERAASFWITFAGIFAFMCLYSRIKKLDLYSAESLMLMSEISVFAFLIIGAALQYSHTLFSLAMILSVTFARLHYTKNRTSGRVNMFLKKQRS